MNSLYEFIYDFIYLNSAFCILRWIHIYIWIYNMNSYMTSYIWFQHPESLYEIINMNSDMISRYFSRSWIHIGISEFMLWIHISFHDQEFICYSSWPKNSDMRTCIWKISWNHNMKSGIPSFQMARSWSKSCPAPTCRQTGVTDRWAIVAATLNPSPWAGRRPVARDTALIGITSHDSWPVPIWNLGTHDFRYDFTIFFIYMNLYLNKLNS